MRHLLKLSFEQMEKTKTFNGFGIQQKHVSKTTAPPIKASQDGICKHCSQVTAESHLLIVTSLKIFQTLVSSIPETLATKLAIFFFRHALQPIWDMRTDEDQKLDVMFIKH